MMKYKYIIIAIVVGVQLTACTDGNEILEQWEVRQAVNANTRTSELTATVTLTTAGTLDAKLTEALGNNKLMVQDLTISGFINASDVETLHTLNALEKLNISNVETEYGYYSFSYSYIDGSGNPQNQHVGEYLYNNDIGSHMFAGMASLKEIKMPINATTIGGHAFQDCTSLTTFTLPDNVHTIYSYAFSRCTSLTTFTQPASLKNISNMAFEGSSLTTLNVSEGVRVVSGFSGCNTLKTVNLPSTLKVISSSAFNLCGSLESITIPEGVEKIEGWAFDYTNLSTIQLPSTLKEIGDYAFMATKLEKVKIPSSVITIGRCAFQHTQLEEVEIPSSVTTMGYGVFDNTQLRILTIPETVTYVDGSLINNCNNLSALFWYSEAEVGDIQGVSENCYLYLQSKNGNTPAWGPNWVNVVIDGVAEVVELKHLHAWSDSRIAFYCPKAFTAKKVSISIHFDEVWTYVGEASGWQTLTLPFTPTSISHAEKGQLAPFGSNIKGAKPFWLRSLAKEGFIDAIAFEPNKPYIIAMPYNPGIYIDEYNISGDVLFEATNIEIPATPAELPASEGPDYYLRPAYSYVAVDSNIYVLNQSWWVDNYNHWGSVFSNTSPYGVNCFEAYITPKSGSGTRSVYTIDTSSASTRSASEKNTTGIPAIGDM